MGLDPMLPLQGAANSWLSMQNSAGATWTAELMFFGCTPFDLRLTDATGQTVVLRYWKAHLGMLVWLCSMLLVVFAVVAVSVLLWQHCCCQKK